MIQGLPQVYQPDAADQPARPTVSNASLNQFPRGTFVDAAKLAAVRSSEAAAVNMSREDRWVQRELGFYEENYTQTEGLTALFITFNVGCKKPPADLSPLLKKTMPDGVTPVDIIAVGLQEVDMSAAAMLKEETEAAFPWITALQALVGADQSPAGGPGLPPYMLFPPKQLVGLMLLVFARKVIVPHMSECSIASVATGALGSVGNKGSIGFRFRIQQTSVCILTCHIAAGQHSTAKRNEDIVSILSGMDFNVSNRQMSLSTNAVLQDQSTFVVVPEVLPKDHDIIVLIGDLNYRVDLPYEAALAHATSGDLAALMKEDQLAREMRNPHTPWQGFVDCTPTFPPTYRFDMGTSTYDTSEKKRIPAFTDRVLFHYKKRANKKVVESRTVQVKQLDAVREILSSDHKPVRAFCIVPVKTLVKELKVQVTADLKERVAKAGLDRVASAKTTVSSTSLHFGSLLIGRGKGRSSITVANVGECVATVNVFRQVAGDSSECAWLRVYPLSADILPGESVDLTVDCVLDHAALEWVHKWQPFRGSSVVAIKSVLVLRVDDGPTHFVECGIEVRPSCFGNLLENITRLESVPCVSAYCEPFQKKPLAGATERNPRPWLPKEVWFLCDAIYRRGCKTPNLFGDDDEDCDAKAKERDDEVDELIKFLDTTAEPIPDSFSVRSIASCLVQFFALLQRPLVPHALYSLALSAGRTGGRVPLYFVQQQLSPMCGNLWLYMMSFLNFLLKPFNQTHNGLTAQFLSELFAGLLLRPKLLGAANQQSDVSNSSLNANPLWKAQQHLRQQVQQERTDATQLVLYFLQPASL